MCTRSSFIAIALLALAGLASGQTSRSSVKVNLPADSPVALVSADWGESRTSERGSALVLNLNTALSLKNTSQRHIRAITWLVLSQEATPGGRASVTKASLDIGPGETFPLRIDLRLLRPIGRGITPGVEMSLDGILFDDLSFYGPNRLDSRRAMLAFELEAQRDRKYFQQVLQAKGAEGLRHECLSSLARQADLPKVDVQWARGGRTTTAEAERTLQFAFLHFPDAPIEPMAGMAHVSQSRARAPQMEIQNKAKQSVRYLEMGWLMKDSRGREFLAGSVPSKTTLAPGQKGQIVDDSILRFTDQQGGAVAIESMTGFVSQVEFADGSVWIPTRTSLGDPRLQKAMGPSGEEIRLTSIYRNKGLSALVEELKKFNR